jgi:hypothetical protein
MVPTFECLFAFLVVGHGRRQLLWFAVTRHPATYRAAVARWPRARITLRQGIWVVHDTG